MLREIWPDYGLQPTSWSQQTLTGVFLDGVYQHCSVLFLDELFLHYRWCRVCLVLGACLSSALSAAKISPDFWKK